MPTVRTYGPRQVSTTPLPDAKRQAHETPLSTGAGFHEARAQAWENVAGTANQLEHTFAAIATQEREHADQTAVFDAKAQLGKWNNDRLYNPETGALNVQGKEAMALPGQVGDEFRAKASEIASTLTSDRQKEAFARITADEELNLNGTLERHAFNERKQYESGVLQSTVETATSTAIANAQDPRRIGQALQDVNGAIDTLGPRLGLSAEQRDVAKRKAATGIHKGVIDRLLTAGQDRQAKAYYEEAKDQIDGSELASIEKVLDAGSTRGAAQRLSDAIVSKATTITEARELVKTQAGDDPKLREEAMRNVEHEFDVRATVARQHDEDLLNTAYNIVTATHDTRKIPPAIWTALGTHQPALRSYEESLAKGTPVETNPRTLYNLLTLSSTDRDGFLKTNLMGYVDQLSKGDLEQLMREQADMRKGKSSGAGMFVSEKAQNDIVDSGLRALGLDLSDSELRKPENKETANRIDALRRSVREAVTRQEAGTNKKATDSEVQGIVDTLIAPTGSRVTAKGWFSDTTAPTYAFETAQAKVQTVTDVPAGERRKIERALASHGVPVSDAVIMQIFNEQLATVRGDR